MTSLNKYAKLRKELLNPAIGNSHLLRKLALSLLNEVAAVTNACNGWQRKYAEADERLRAAERQIADLFKENVRLKSGIAGLVHLGIRHGDIEVMRIAGDAQMATPCTDSIIDKIAAGIGVKGE